MTEEEAERKRLYGCPHMDKESFECLATLSAKRAKGMIETEFYTDVGKAFVKKFLYFVGALCVGVGLWLHSKGFL